MNMMDKNTCIKIYGVIPWDLKESLDAPENVRHTHNAKYNAHKTLIASKRDIEQMLGRIERIPEEDNSEHSAMVCEWCEMIQEALSLLHRRSEWPSGNSEQA